MDNEKLVESIAEFAASKNIDRPTVINMLREVLENIIKKKYGKDSNFDIVINPQKGHLQAWQTRTVVADEEFDPNVHNTISLTAAQQIEKDFEIGEEVVEEVPLSKFGRRAVIEGLNLLIRKKNILEKDQLYERYHRCIGNIISAEVGYSTPRHTILYDDDKNELFLPKKGEIPHERFVRGSYIKVIVENVENKKGKVFIVVSRSSKAFLQALLTLEIPEIYDSIVVIKKIARIPGVRSKIIVESQDDRIDPTGACIGRNARRIQTISKEHLNHEKLDIITYTTNLPLLVKRIVRLTTPVEVETTDHEVVIYGTSDQMPALYPNLLFLKNLLGKPVRIINLHAKNEAEEDVHLDEFANEIDASIIDLVKKAGFTTAKGVLNTSKSVLKEKTNLEEATINTIYDILAKEFHSS